MSAGKAFRYEMEPVLLARKWELDDLVAEWKKADYELEKVRQEAAGIQEGMKGIQTEWAKRHAGLAYIDVGSMQVMQKYLRDLSDRHARKRQEIEKLEKECDAWKEKIALSKKSVEILEDDKVKMKKIFLKSFDDMQLKQLDDQWNVLRSYREEG